MSKIHSFNVSLQGCFVSIPIHCIYSVVMNNRNGSTYISPSVLPVLWY